MSEIEAARISEGEYDEFWELRTPTDELRIAEEYSLFLRTPTDRFLIFGSPETGFDYAPPLDQPPQRRNYRLDAVIEDIRPRRWLPMTIVKFNLSLPGTHKYSLERRYFRSDGSMAPHIRRMLGVVAREAYFYRPPEGDDGSLSTVVSADSDSLDVPV